MTRTTIEQPAGRERNGAGEDSPRGCPRTGLTRRLSRFPLRRGLFDVPRCTVLCLPTGRLAREFFLPRDGQAVIDVFLTESALILRNKSGLVVFSAAVMNSIGAGTSISRSTRAIDRSV